MTDQDRQRDLVDQTTQLKVVYHPHVYQLEVYRFNSRMLMSACMDADDCRSLAALLNKLADQIEEAENANR